MNKTSEAATGEDRLLAENLMAFRLAISDELKIWVSMLSKTSVPIRAAEIRRTIKELAAKNKIDLGVFIQVWKSEGGASPGESLPVDLAFLDGLLGAIE